ATRHSLPRVTRRSASFIASVGLVFFTCNFCSSCPFFEMIFGLLRPNGQLGFIVSNAFAKREFVKPLVEDFFPTVDFQKIVDCSGLMFPVHGTPTCIVLVK